MGQESCPNFSYDVENQAARKVKSQRNFSGGNKFIHRILLRGQPPQKGDAMKNIDLEVIIRGTPKDALAQDEAQAFFGILLERIVKLAAEENE